MRDFIAIDFETGNPKRVSACALGYARVVNGRIAEANGYLIKPVGGHAPFQSKIHGITEEHTFCEPSFGELFPDIRHIFDHKVVAHSLFDQQVLMALSEHFGLRIDFEYFDTSSLAKERLPHLKNHKLKTLVAHFGLPGFRHHDAKEDAIACAHICLRLLEPGPPVDVAANRDELHVFTGIVTGILADDEINYKEAYQLLYWLEDHDHMALRFRDLHKSLRTILEDDGLSAVEAELLRNMLRSTSDQLAK